MHLIFEETTSPLYHSNDGRLHIAREVDAKRRSVWTVTRRDDDEVVFASYDRVKADAYVAGYDEARRTEKAVA